MTGEVAPASAQNESRVIHVITSGNHYEFNLAWVMEPMPGEGE